VLRLNGVEVPQLGHDGEVIHKLVFNRQSLERLRAEPKGQP